MLATGGGAALRRANSIIAAAMDLLDPVRRHIEQQRLLAPGQALVVGVSGGADSLCLLDCLRRLAYKCVVAHLDHGLRPASRREAQRVGQLAASLGLPFESGRAGLAGARGSLEEAARIERYRFLASVAHSHSASAIAVGHTADDQAETVLMHLLRGAGPEGLRGMLPVTRLGDWVGVPDAGELILVRPLLEVRRQQTQAHCRAIGWEPIVDESNADPRFFRNRLRHALLPELERYNPRIRAVLARTAQVMAGQAALTEELLERAWDDWVRSAGEGALALQRSQLEAAPLALQRAALRRAVSELRPELRDVGFDTVERVVRGVQRGNGHRRTIVGGLEVVPLEDELILRRPGAAISFPGLPQLPDRQPQPLPLPGSLQLASGWQLAAEPSPPADWRPASRYQTLLDCDRMGGELTVRTPQPGDRIRPLGMRGSVKLSDLFVNRKVPWPARERWPLVCAGSEILWAVGLHVSRSAAPPRPGSPAVRLVARPPAP